MTCTAATSRAAYGFRPIISDTLRSFPRKRDPVPDAPQSSGSPLPRGRAEPNGSPGNRIAAFDRRVFALVFALADYGRPICRAVVIGLGTVTAAGVMAGAVTVTAAWIIAVVFATNPNLSRGPGCAGNGCSHQAVQQARWCGESLGFGRDLGDSRMPRMRPSLPYPPPQAGEGREEVAAALPSAPTSTSQLPPNRASERANETPLPSPRPLDGPQIQAQHEIAGPPAAPALPQVAAATFSPPASTSFFFQKRFLSQLPPNRPSEPANNAPLPSQRPLHGPEIQTQHDIARPPAAPALPQVAAVLLRPLSGRPSICFRSALPRSKRNNAISLPGRESRTAIYDIAAHTVYLPNGVRLEAHSGLGRRLDDPRYVDEKGRGATPPNVYDLVLRNEPFHGVRASRLNPVDGGRMFGRDGILAHTYMLGPTGQSFGCISFKKNYPEFLETFLRGEIDRLVVVPHLETKTSDDERARRGNADRYAFNNR